MAVKGCGFVRVSVAPAALPTRPSTTDCKEIATFRHGFPKVRAVFSRKAHKDPP
jgi:hypothetical protein